MARICLMLMVGLAMADPSPADGPAFVVRTASSMQKVFRDSFHERWLTSEAGDAITISGARNESESFQVVVLPFRPLKNLRWSVESDLGADAVHVAPVGFIEVTKNSARFPPNYPDHMTFPGWWPDPIFSTWTSITNVQPRQCRPLWVTVAIASDASPGDHRITLRITADDAPTVTVQATVHVYNFKLPDRTTLKTSFWTGSSYLPQYYREVKDIWPIEKRFLKLALDNRITPVNIQPRDLIDIRYDSKARKYTFDFSRLERWLRFVLDENDRKGNLALLTSHQYVHHMNWRIYEDDNPRPTHKLLDHGEAFKALLEQYLPALKQFMKDNGWYDYGYLSIVDEPTVSAEEPTAWVHPIVKRMFPDLNVVAPLTHMAPVEGLDKYIDVWVPGFFSVLTQRNLAFWQDRQQAGEEVWGYICYKTSCIDYESIDHRMLAWLCWKYDLKGFLYWGIINWAQTGGPAKKPQMFVDNPESRWPRAAKWQSMDLDRAVPGDGYLMYPGPDGQAWSSIRLENIRDGIEDHEYFSILRRLRDAAPSRIAQIDRLLTIGDDIIAAPVAYTRDPRQLLERRDAVARMIETLLAP